MVDSDSTAAGIVAPYELVVFTACSVNYLVKAMAMCRSVLDHHPDVALVILLADRKRRVTLTDQRVRLLWAEDLGFPEFLQCAFKYNIIELNTALKPFVALRLLENYKKVIYLDPDICLFSSLSRIAVLLDSHSTILTPHAISPYLGTGRPNDQDLLRFGCFNLGFFAVNASNNARAMLQWWHQQCLHYCFYEPQVGLGVDQKWMDLAAAFCSGVHVLKDVGVNVAFWNLHERQLKKTSDGWVVNELIPLCFVHFSSFVENNRDVIADKQTRYEAGSCPEFAEAGDVYRGYLTLGRTMAHVESTQYGFAQFDNGRAISPALRRFYALVKNEKFCDCQDPFLENGPVYRFAQKHRLLTGAKSTQVHINFKATSGYQREQRVIAMLFRWSLRILGPDRYFAFLRYLSQYTSIFNQSNLFK